MIQTANNFHKARKSVGTYATHIMVRHSLCTIKTSITLIACMIEGRGSLMNMDETVEEYGVVNMERYNRGSIPLPTCSLY